MDEARHVEVFSRYLREKIEWEWPITSAHLELLDATIHDSRWDFKYLGMQILIEGLAMAAFGNLFQIAQEPLLKELLKYVMRDESRHVAFGVLSLAGFYSEMPATRSRTARTSSSRPPSDAATASSRRKCGSGTVLTHRDVVPLVLNDPTRQLFQTMLFSKIVPNCKKLGLLDRNDQWLRRRFEEMDVIQFEHLEDTGEEYESFAVAT